MILKLGTALNPSLYLRKVKFFIITHFVQVKTGLELQHSEHKIVILCTDIACVFLSMTL